MIANILVIAYKNLRSWRIQLLLLILLFLVQWRLWFGQIGIIAIQALQDKISIQQEQNRLLHVRNNILHEQISLFQNDQQRLINYARYELGMVKKGETFYKLIDNTSLQ